MVRPCGSAQRTWHTARAPTRLRLLAPLRHRPFCLLFLGQLISNLGDWLNLLALLDVDNPDQRHPSHWYAGSFTLR